MVINFQAGVYPLLDFEVFTSLKISLTFSAEIPPPKSLSSKLVKAIISSHCYQMCYTRFGHSETLLPLLAFLELPFSDLKHFDTTIISPFSANAVFVLYSCSSSAGRSCNSVYKCGEVII